MRNSTQENYYDIHRDNRPSRFLVDLNQKNENEEEIEINNSSLFKNKIKYFFNNQEKNEFDPINIDSEISDKELFEDGLDSVGNFSAKDWYLDKIQEGVNIVLENQKVKRLAFYPFVRFFISTSGQSLKALFNLSYYTGLFPFLFTKHTFLLPFHFKSKINNSKENVNTNELFEEEDGLEDDEEIIQIHYKNENEDKTLKQVSSSTLKKWEKINEDKELVMDLSEKINETQIERKRDLPVTPIRLDYSEDNNIDSEEKVEKIVSKKGFWKKLFKSKNTEEDFVYEETTEEIDENIFKPTFSFKPVMVFASIAIVAILPVKATLYYFELNDLKGRVMGVSESAANDMLAAGKSVTNLDLNTASENFLRAKGNFQSAQEEINNIADILKVFSAVIPNKDVKLAANSDYILEAGQLSADLGNEMTLALSGLQNEEKEIKTIIEVMHEHVKKGSVYAIRLNEIVNKINSELLPDEYKDKFVQLQGKGTLLANSLIELVDMLEKAKIFLGFEYDTRYLVVFQNNTELRGSGGFLGSYALVDFREGKIKNLEVPAGGSYDTEAGLKVRVVAPEPLWLLNPLWHFWDSNWWPDWEMSAKKIKWFYEKSGGPTVDGVISLTPTTMEKLLEIIGPIDMFEEYGKVIDSENFWGVVQTITEQKPGETNPFFEEAEYIEKMGTSSIEMASSTLATSTEVEIKHTPKKIIGDLLKIILEDLPEDLNKDKFLSLLQVVEESLTEKHVLFYFTNEELQNKTEEYGWDGKIKNTAWDYLMVVNTNIGGAKSDRMIKEKIYHEANVQSDGSIVNTIKITRIHTGIKGHQFTGVRNVDWMRIYVPEGSKLIEAKGFKKPDSDFFEYPEANWTKDPDLEAYEGKAMTDLETGTKIYNELGKTVFANWSMIDPGERIDIYIKYTLPFKIELNNVDLSLLQKIESFANPNQKDLIPYALLVQKQPGSIASEFISMLKLPENYNIEWNYPDNLSVSSKGWQITDKLYTDKYWAVMITK